MKNGMMKCVALMTVILLLSVLLMACGSEDSDDFSKINEAIKAFKNLKSGTLVETFVGSETTNYSLTGTTDSNRDDSKCTLKFEMTGKGCNYVESTYSYFESGNSAFYGEKQQDGQRYTSTDDAVLQDESLWKHIADAGNNYAIHPIMEYMEYIEPPEFISKDYNISTEGKLTRYDFTMNQNFIDGVAGTYNADAVYTAEKRNMSYWIDEKGVLVKHSNEIVDHLEWNGKTRDRSISKVVELTEYKK